MLGMDLMGPFPRSSNRNMYVLIFVDYYTQWLELFPLRKTMAEAISRILTQQNLTQWGIPDYILSDRGSQFVSSVFQSTCQTWNVSNKLTSCYHPRTHLTEQGQRTLKTIISPYVCSQHKHWNKHLPGFWFALNSAIRESTGVTPAELNLNWPVRGPLDIVLQPRDIVPDSLAYPKVSQLTLRCLSQEIFLWLISDRQGYDKHRSRMNLGVQDRVWLHTHSLSKAENQACQLAPK